MSSLTLLGDTSGSIVLDAPAISGSTTITLAAQSGTLNVGGPAFGVYAGSTTLLINGANTKVAFNTKEYDTANCFNTTTSTFTPNVAGYYQINAAVCVQATGTFYMIATLYKNGSSYRQGSIASGNAAAYNIGQVNSLVYMNGTTDYLEVYGAQNSGANYNSYNVSTNTFWNGFLARTA
jgi:hypothetical protein